MPPEYPNWPTPVSTMSPAQKDQPPVGAPTTTTVATVTTTTTPAKGSVPWMQSLKFKAYLGGWLTLVIGWLIDNITTHQFAISGWTWIAITISTLLTIRSIIADWMSPNVTAPFAVLNKNNPVEPNQ